MGEVVLNKNNLRKPISLELRAKIKGNFPYYGATGQIDSLNDYTHAGEHVLIGEDGANLLSKAKPLAFIAKGKYWVNNHAHAVKTLSEMKCEILEFYINSLDLSPWVTGSAQPKLTRGNLDKIPFMLPPLNEQNEIIRKVNDCLVLVDSIKTRLDQIPQILKRFRQAVLSAAVSGKLTEKWRTENNKPVDIKLVSLGDVIINGPQNGIYKPSTLYGSGYKIVRIDGFYDGVLCDWSTFKRVQLEDSDVEKWSLRNNDILINRVNSIEYLGKCGLVENLPEETVFESNIMRITLNSEKVVAKFITIFLSSITGLSRLRENAKLAVNQASINQQDVKSCKIELPSISEQTEIVARVKKLFAWADNIEKQVNAAQQRVNNLTQSILAKAFRGELTEQWRKDHPQLISGENSAAALLEKIKAERAAQTKKSKKKA